MHRNIGMIQTEMFQAQKLFHDLQRKNKKLRGEMKSRFVKIPLHISMHFIFGNEEDRINWIGLSYSL